MRSRRGVAYAAALLFGTASLACAPLASANTGTSTSAVSTGGAPLVSGPYREYATGYGATLDDAKADAEDTLDWGCTYGTNGIPHLVSDGQEADGSWWAYMKAYCSYE